MQQVLKEVQPPELLRRIELQACQSAKVWMQQVLKVVQPPELSRRVQLQACQRAKAEEIQSG